MKHLAKVSLALLVALAVAVPAYASEITGTISTGITTGIQGTVLAAPTASPPAGTYTGSQSVTLAANGSTSIHYFLNTTDLDSALTCSSGTTYTAPVTIDGSGLLRAIACYGSHASAPASFAYVIESSSQPAAPSGGGGGGGSALIPTPSSPSGDINKDGNVDIADFNTLMVNWGKTGSNIPGDVNNDGTVDILDFTTLMVNWTA